MLKYVHTVQYSIDKKIIESRIVLARGRLGYIEWLSKTLKYPSPCPIPAAFFTQMWAAQGGRLVLPRRYI